MVYDSSQEYRILKLIDLDQMFREANNPILINQIAHMSKDYSQTLASKIYSRTGELNFVCSCACGNIQGNAYQGATCHDCNTVVSSDFSPSSKLENDAWISMPTFIPGVLHPTLYIILADWLGYGKSKGNYIDAIVNPKIDLPPELVGVVTGRGHKWFYENFDYLMDHFLNAFDKTAEKKKKKAAYIRILLHKYRHMAFCRYLPVLSNFLHTITAEGNGGKGDKMEHRMTDRASKFIMEAAIDLSCLEHSTGRARSNIETEATIHGAYKAYVDYYRSEEGIINRLAKKDSLIRKHIFGARFHWSFRAVIVPITSPHNYDEIHIPWSVGVNLLRVHIIGRLMQRKGIPYHQAFAQQTQAIVKYDAEIDQIMIDLIAECPEAGLPTLFGRNPSLKRGSLQKLYVTMVKKEVTDNTIAVSTLVIKDANA